MPPRPPTLTLLVCLGLIAAAPAAEPELPDGGEPITPAALPAEPELVDDAEETELSVVDTPEYGPAVRATVDGGPDMAWLAGYNTDITAAVAEGDAVLVTFLARVVPGTSMTGRGTVTVNFEDNGEPWTKSIYRDVQVGEAWERVTLAFAAHKAFGPGEAQVALHVGHPDQTLEIAGLRAFNFADRVPLAKLPSRELGYDGSAPDAPWRAEAEQRIDRLRKADLAVRVVDAAGRPVEGVEVDVEMQRHAFPFGTAVAARLIADDSPEAERYRELTAEMFNEVVIENALKWRTLYYRDYDDVLATFAWAEANRIPVRGHCLVWPGEDYLPDPILDVAADPERVHVADYLTKEHVAGLATLTRGRVSEWDVVNEPRANRLLQDALSDEAHGADVIAEWFELAREADPDAGLYLNDYSILTASLTSNREADFYLELIEKLQDRGAPITGAGLQGHFGSNLVGAERVWDILDRFGETGLDVKITELDIDLDDQDLQARYMRDLLTMLFAHEAVDGVLVWGFWEGRHWRPRSAFYDMSFELRPIGEAWRSKVLGDWRTSETLTTDADGRVDVRGFKGLYRVTARAPGREAAQTEVQLGDDGVTLELAID